ncbi:mechanosensitive ion channel family protein [Flavobacterium hibernum]|uniref:Mechanosensitive ion channel protein MscS n=1 Tax=Flavobacterium hibernum TaxID=37752 RepID=A0A0D0F1F0_9FLAO|nr:mechanosensitive ion channel domain-containing protein [Flavobacterium hibernum]KIO53406.1 mechanosensitive ion channel protein MscS [Flavobacterium hibernum]OXA88009.1 mechanosensitive ion channel protein MscS [Flavobacterium hibernum]STO10605.1 Potassium efflux system KefA precursor [Flavobacterium hibernum]
MIQKRNYIYLLALLAVFFYAPLTYSQTTPPKTETKSKLFEETTTDSDFLMAIEKAGEVLESAHNDTEFDGNSHHLFGDIKRTQSKLDLILASLKGSNPNVRNQQMYGIVLKEIEQELDEQNAAINARNLALEKIKNRVIDLRKDKTLMVLIKDTIRRKQFKQELANLKNRYLSTDSLMTKNQGILNTNKRLTVERKIAVSNALIMVDTKLEKSGISMLKKEYPALWSTDSTAKKIVGQNIKAKIIIEENVAAYYLSYRAGGLITLVLLMGLLSWYIARNLKYLNNNGHAENLSQFNFKYLNKGVIIPVAVIGLNIAVVSNLYAPAMFIELIQLALLGLLTFIFKSSWSKIAMRNWVLLLVLFLVLCFLDLFIAVGFIQRCAFIIINILGIRYGFVQLKSIKDQLYIKGFFKWATIIFIGLNILALLNNLFGRVSLANMLSLTAFISLTQIVALSVLLKIVLEIILLQIYTTRVKRGIEKIFDFESLSDTLKKPFIIVITYMWVVVIASNLNFWESLRTGLAALLSHPNTIGSITFTLGNIVLFFIIIWMAHLLQNYVAYFFGEIDDENEENVNKRQHSKLLITRLVVLISGYLLAVAASGMPLDKLSILLGALGVGVGLGLQNVVNNFVSGIILIFDKPIQIGDVINISSESGRVKSMGLRTTKINAANGAEIIIPNGNLLSQNITNWTYTDNFKLVEIAIEVTGDIMPEEINAIVLESLESMQLVNNTKTPQLYYTAISEGKFNLQVKFWCSIYRTEETISSARQVLFSNFKAKGLTLST